MPLDGVDVMRAMSIFRKFAVATALLIAPAASFAGIFLSVGIAPPILPVYTQPICPGDGYLWTPGYWAYGDEGYFWVPGVWVQPPTVGYLWTPGYWGWGGNAFLFHAGYWGPHIGFYGGVNYGFGYGGVGYQGGYWNHGAFAYNRSVNNINVTNIHNTYNQTVIVNNNVTNNRVSYNGGNGGLQARANAQEQVAAREQHVQPTQNQVQHQQFASQNRAQLASVNHGTPAIAAQGRVGDRASAVPARGVNGREANQQQRIGNGLQNGQMTAGEARNAENRQANINQQVRTERQANGGTLNQQETATGESRAERCEPADQSRQPQPECAAQGATASAAAGRRSRGRRLRGVSLAKRASTSAGSKPTCGNGKVASEVCWSPFFFAARRLGDGKVADLECEGAFQGTAGPVVRGVGAGS